MDGGAARANNGSLEQQLKEQKKKNSLSNSTVGKDERGPQATTRGRRSSTSDPWSSSPRSRRNL